MSPIPAIRTQVDGLDEEYSLHTGIDCGNREDMARQEFKDDTDVNKILGRYGVNADMRPLQFGNVNYDLDLQQALEAIIAANEAMASLPDTLRERYPSWESLSKGLRDGTLKRDLETQRLAAELALADQAGAQPNVSVDSAKP